MIDIFANMLEFLGTQEVIRNVYLFKCVFSVDKYSQEMYRDYDIEQPLELFNAVPKRHAEFIAGRFMAKKACNFFSAPDTQVRIGRDRCPVWPGVVVGSISHTHNYAICAASKKTDYLAIGVDIENYFSKETCESLQGIILKQSEINFLHSLSCDYGIALAVVFSAKESFFKAVYPRVRYFFDFDVVDILMIDFKREVLTLRLEVDLCAEYLKGDLFSGKFMLLDKIVVTLVAIK